MPNPYNNLQWSQAAIQPGQSQVPVEAFKYLAEKKEDSYWLNQDRADVIVSALAESKVRKEDVDIRKGLTDKVSSYIDEVSRRGGDWENSGIEMRGLARDVLTNEKFRLATERYAKDEASKDELKKRRASNNISESGYWLAMNSIENDYKGVGEKNEQGFYNEPSYYDPMTNIAVDDEIRKRISAIRATQEGGTWQKDSRFNIPGMSKMSTTQIKEAEVNLAIDELLNNGDMAALLDEEARANTARGNTEGDTRDKLVEKYKKSYESSSGVLSRDEQYKFFPKQGETQAEMEKRLKAEMEEGAKTELLGETQEIVSKENLEYADYHSNKKYLAELSENREELRTAMTMSSNELDNKSAEIANMKAQNPDNVALDKLMEEKAFLENQIVQQQSVLDGYNDKEESIEHLHRIAAMQVATEGTSGLTSDQVEVRVAEVFASLEGTETDKVQAAERAGIYFENRIADQGILGNPAGIQGAMDILELNPAQQQEVLQRYEQNPGGTIAELKGEYVTKNMSTYITDPNTKAFQERLLDITDGSVMDQSLVTWANEDSYEEAVGKIFRNKGMVTNGYKNGRRVAMEGFTFEMMGYNTGKMGIIDKEESARYNSLAIRGMTVRDGNLAFVATPIFENSEDYKIYGRGKSVTFSDEQQTNEWIDKNPELEAPFVALEAIEIAAKSLGQDVPINMHLIDPSNRPFLVVSVDVPDPYSVGGEMLQEKEHIKIVPSISAEVQLDGPLLYNFTYKAVVQSSPTEGRTGYAIPQQEMDYLLAKYLDRESLPKNEVSQNEIIRIVKNLKQSLVDDHNAREEAKTAANN